MCVGRDAEAFSLLFNAEWVLRVLETGGVLQYQLDVRLCVENLRGKCESVMIFDKYSNEEAIMGLEIVSKATLLSAHYCNSARTSAFQLFGRLRGSKERAVEKFLSDVEKVAPRPWLMPITRCLTGADIAMPDNIPVPYRCRVAKFTSAGLMRCGWVFERNEIFVSEQTPGKVETFEMSSIVASTGGIGRQSASANENVRSDRTKHQEDVEVSSRQGHGMSSFDGKNDDSVCSDGDVNVVAPGTSVIPEQNRRILYGDISSAGAYSVTGHEDGSITVWDNGRREMVRSFRVHRERVNCVSINESGEYIASGSWDGRLGVWKIGRGEQVGQTLSGHIDRVNRVGMSGDGKPVVSGSDDKTVRVWDVESGKQVGQTLT